MKQLPQAADWHEMLLPLTCLLPLILLPPIGKGEGGQSGSVGERRTVGYNARGVEAGTSPGKGEHLWPAASDAGGLGSARPELGEF